MKWPWVSRKRYEEMVNANIVLVGQKDNEIRHLRNIISEHDEILSPPELDPYYEDYLIRFAENFNPLEEE